jgi:hypothetical protein
MADQEPFRPEWMQPETVPPSPPSAVATGVGRRRPTAVTAIGVLLLVFAAVGLFSAFVTVSALTSLPRAALPLPPAVMIFTLVTGVIGLVLEIVMGVALLRMLPWARKGTLITLIVLFVLSVASTVATDLTIRIPNAPSPTAAHTAAIGGIVFGILFSLIIYGLMAFYLTRRDVVEAFGKKAK